MSSKQDAVAARTAADIERKYNFNKSFAEVMGLANDAQDAADRANDAAQKAEAAVGNLDEALTQEEIFNRLTKDGTMKGLYMENGELYINASYLKSGQIAAELIDTVNLIAQKLRSVSGDNEVSIDGGTFAMHHGGEITAELWNEYGSPILFMYRFENGTFTDQAEMTPTSLKIGGNSMMPVVYFSGYGGKAKLCLNGGSMMELFWKDNGDGTYSLMGK